MVSLIEPIIKIKMRENDESGCVNGTKKMLFTVTPWQLQPYELNFIVSLIKPTIKAESNDKSGHVYGSK